LAEVLTAMIAMLAQGNDQFKQGDGMEPDDLLCSRNARSRTPLVGRAQWKINQPPSLEKQRASLEGSFIWMVVPRRAQLETTQTIP